MAAQAVLTGNENAEFFQTIDDAIKQLERLDKVTVNAKSNVNGYAKSFNSLTRELKNFAKVKIGDKRGTSSNRSSSYNVKNETEVVVKSMTKSLEKGVVNTFSDTFKAISSLSGVGKDYGAIFKNTTKVAGTAVKGTQLFTKSLGSVVSVGAKAAGIVGLVVTALVAMGEAGKAAYDRNIDLNRALMQMGANANEFKDASVSTANQVKEMKHQWTLIGQAAQDFFEPVYEFFVNIGAMFTKAIYDISGASSKEKYNSANTGSRVSWYTGMLQSQYYEPESSSVPAINSIAGTARQSGFDLNSAVNLGIGTYDAAFRLAQKYGLEAADIAQQLAAAWQSGSDAAKDYGVVVNDTVLSGFMASKGVDIVNIQISDAMKQYYRYQLMQEELGASSQDAMQNMIKSWTKLGMQIEATKQKLFSFDEVIQLTALDTEIPIVGKPSVGGYESTSPSGNGEPINPIVSLPPYDWGTPPTPSPYDWGIPPTVPAYDWGQIPEVNIDWGVIPDLAIDWGIIPNLVINWGVIPNLAIDWGVIPNLAIDWEANWDAVREWASDLEMGWIRTINSLANIVKKWQANWDAVTEWGSDLIKDWTAASGRTKEWVISAIKRFTAEPAWITKIKEFIANLKAGFEKLGNLDIFGFLKGVSRVPLAGLSEATGGKMTIGNELANAFNTLTKGQLDKTKFIEAYNTVISNSGFKKNLDSLGQWFTNKAPINVQNIDQIGHDVGAACATALLAIPTLGTAGSFAGVGSAAGSAAQAASTGGKIISFAGKAGAAGATAAAIMGQTMGVAAAEVNVDIKNKDELEKLNKDLENIGRKKTTAKVESKADTKSIKDIIKDLNSIDNKKATVDVNADTKNAESGIKNINKNLGSLTQKKWTANINARDNTTRVLQNIFNNASKVLSLLSRVSSFTGNYAISNLASYASNYVSTRHFASGGVGTREINNATLFEGNKKEAVVPLESQAGIDYLANAMREASGGNGAGAAGNITINLSLSGIFDTDDRGKWERLAEKLSETIQIQNNRRGDLNYGASF